MELRQLRYLVAIADEGQFTKAAAREHVAQPALSQAIARLEEQVGMRLIVRSPRRSTLTDAGEILVRAGRRMIAEADAARADLDELSGLRRGRVLVGAMQTLGSFDLPGLLAEFRTAHPGVELVVREEPSLALARLVREDQLDLAFLSVGTGFDGEGLETIRLGQQPLVVALPATHDLAGRKRVRFAELAGDSFVSLGPGSALHGTLFEACREAGFEPSISVQTKEIPRIRAMVSRGLGVALLPAAEAEGPGPEIATAALRDPSVTINVTLCWRSRRHLAPAAQALLDSVLERAA